MAAKALAYDLVIIGGGSGGLQAAWDAATKHKQKVAIVDTQKSHGPPYFSAIGGTCVNVGCVPKKLFVTGATYREHFKDAKGFGWQLDAAAMQHDWSAMVEAKNKAISDINDSYLKDMFGGSVEGLDFIHGWASFVDKTTVSVRADKPLDSEVTHSLAAKQVLVASGGWPFIPDIPGREHVITSNEAFYLPEAPKRPLVVGGGYIAVEFASIFEAFKPADGEVTLAYRGELFLRGFDPCLRAELRDQLSARGINLRFKLDVAKVELADNGMKRVTFNDGSVGEYDVVMYATGRTPNVAGMNLDKIGVETRGNGAVIVDLYGRTNVDGVWAIGDVTDRLQLTPVAIREGAAFVSTAYGGKPVAADHTKVASAVFTIPTAGTCGLTEEQAAKEYPVLRVYQVKGTPLMHQLTGNSFKKYFMKLIVDHATDVVVGCHMVFPEAAEVIQLVGVAMKCGVKLENFRETTGVHPTTAEGLCEAEMEPSFYLVKGEKHESLPAHL